MFKTFAGLVRLLRAEFEYDGPGDSVSAVEKFITDNDIPFSLGKSKSIGEALRRLKTVTISVSADAGEDVVVQDDSAAMDDESKMDDAEYDDEEEMPAKSRRTDDRDRKRKGALFNAGAPRPANPSEIWQKRYAGRIAAGRAVFSDPEQAEGFAALMRLRHAGARKYAGKERDGQIVKTFQTNINVLGGAFVPEDFQAEVIDLAEGYGVALRVANVTRMTRDVQTFPRITSDIALNHVQEGGTISNDDAGTDNVSLTAKKVGRIVKISNELLEDSAVNVPDQYARIIARAYANRIDLDFFLGDATSTYGGNEGLAHALPGSSVPTFTGAYLYAGGSSTASSLWSEIDGDDIELVIGSIENTPDNEFVLCCSRQFYYQVMRRLATSAGGVTAKELTEFNTGYGNVRGDSGPNAIWGGIPVYFTQVMPTATAVSSKVLYGGNIRAAAMIGQRRDLSIDTSTEAYWEDDVTAMRVTARYAINVHGDGRGSTVGPVACLCTAAS